MRSWAGLGAGTGQLKWWAGGCCCGNGELLFIFLQKGCFSLFGISRITVPDFTGFSLQVCHNSLLFLCLPSLQDEKWPLIHVTAKFAFAWAAESLLSWLWIIFFFPVYPWSIDCPIWKRWRVSRVARDWTSGWSRWGMFLLLGVLLSSS